MTSHNCVIIIILREYYKQVLLFATLRKKNYSVSILFLSNYVEKSLKLKLKKKKKKQEE